ncbi:hypothetical protein FPANT_8812 [Fusarium pseudoanthophilum]|uniref:F-box domain-containing protein n=1 Tax=Fusarium pseudoanthophilum TaxID=48495 RepID=A0A8H5NW93_9HYPO|nr:hypothetical protein FPANT_8812 [Fusarium pseudoanthophilum]
MIYSLLCFDSASTLLFLLLFLSNHADHTDHDTSTHRHAGKMAGHILNCPDEVLDLIVKLLPNVKATRETCKRLNRIASPYLFPVLSISCHQLDLDVFRTVAKNPLLIGGVRELVIHETKIFSSFRDWPNYKNGSILPKDSEARGTLRGGVATDSSLLDESPPSQESTLDHCELFNNILESHQKNRLAHADYHALKQALPRLKRLRSLVLSDRNAENDGSTLFQKRPHFETGGQSLELSSPTAKLGKRLQSKNYVYVPLAPGFDSPSTGNGLADKASVNRIDWSGDQFIRGQTTDGGVAGWDVSMMNGAESRDETRDEELLIIARQEFGLHLALLVFEDEALQSQLTEFRVDASIPDHGHVASLVETPGINFNHAIPPNKTFPHLRKLTFSGGYIDPEQLCEFIRRHAPTLKTLNVEDCVIGRNPPRRGEDYRAIVVSELRSLYRSGALKLESGLISRSVRAIETVHGSRDRFRTLYARYWKYCGDGKWRHRLRPLSSEKMKF